MSNGPPAGPAGSDINSGVCGVHGPMRFDSICSAGGEGDPGAEWTLAAALRADPVSLLGSTGCGSWTEGSLSFRSDVPLCRLEP